MSENNTYFVSIIKETLTPRKKLGKKIEAEDFKDIADKMIPLLDEFGIDPVTIEPTGFIWGQGDNTHKEYRPGLKLEFFYTEKDAENILYVNMMVGALTYLVNKTYPGAKAITTVNQGKTAFYPGSHV
jgi:hypothetical protein